MKPGEMFQEIEFHLLSDERPSEYLEKASEAEIFSRYPYELLKKMKKTSQSPKYHPEGNVWIHTMMVVDVAARYRMKSENPRVFMWAAFLHDIGKPSTTRLRKGKITSYDHDTVGEGLAREFLKEFTADETFIEEVCGLVRYHMQILFVSKSTEKSRIQEMKRCVDIREAAMLGFCDRIGRAHVDVRKEKESIQRFLKACGVSDVGFEMV